MLRLLSKLKIDVTFSWELGLFHLIWLLIFATNISWNTYLTGWDALNPEFNTILNLQRSLFAGWQENYGTGTLGGHGFAAMLPHTIAAGVLDLVLPEQLVRQIFTLLTMYFGSLGTAILAKKLLNSYFSTLAGSRYIYLISLTSGLFYAFNLGSTQIFYLPLEAFSIQFAALPWLYYFLLKFIDHRNWKTAFHFFIANFAASTQGFIPSLFVAYVFGIFVFFLGLLLFIKEKKEIIKTSFSVLLLILLANSYWMGPFAYYVVNRNDIFLHSYNNITSTSDFVEKNQLYGSLPQVALLKSFFLESMYNGELIFKPWLDWYKNFPIPFLAAVFFIIALFGALVSFGKHQPPILKSLSVGYFFYLTALTTDTPPFSWFTKVLYIISPTFEQAFRTPFTKFGIGVSFFYSLFFAIGLFFLIKITMTAFKNHSITIGKWIITTALIATILIGAPHFIGKTFFKGLRVSIPQSYFDVIQYFKNQPNGRIADLPVDCHEGWYTYSWGYIGSGFYWYGIKQPILARSFDVWSSETESYYWELSTALRHNDYFMAEEVLKKYGVTWILWDDNLQHCQSGNGFIYQRAFLDYLQSDNSQFSLDETFTAANIGAIQIFKRKEASSSFVTSIVNPVSITTTENYLDSDQALNYVNGYVDSGSLENSIYFPFRSLLSTRNGLADSITVEKKGDTQLLISTDIPFELSGNLQTVSFKELEESIPVEVILTRNGDVLEATIHYLFPEIFINEDSVYSYYPSINIGSFPYEPNQRIAINQFEISNGKGVFNLSKNNTIQVLSPTGSIIFNWNSDSSMEHQAISNESLIIPVVIGTKKLTVLHHLTPEFDSQSYSLAANFKSLIPRNCKDGSTNTLAEIARENNGTQFLQFKDTKSESCLTIDMTYLEPESSYLIETTTQHLRGNPLTLNLTSAEGVFLASTEFASSQAINVQYFVIPPTSSKFAYRMQLQNKSLNKESSNRIYDVNFLSLPYNILKDLKISSLNQVTSEMAYINSIQFNETQYSAFSKISNDENKTYLILSQSFDKGWIAFPRFSPWKKLPHTTYNGWANAWLLPAGSNQITIIFWPELLILTGYSLLIVTCFWLWQRSK